MNVDRQVLVLHEILRKLSYTLSSAALYSPGHPRVEAGISEILDPLRQFLSKVPELTLIIVKDDLLFQGKPLERGPQTLRVANLLEGLGVGHIKFLAGIEAADLRLLVRCARGQQPLAALENSAGISLGTVDAPSLTENGSGIPLDSFEQLDGKQLEELKSLYDGIGEKAQIDMRQMLGLVAGFIAAFRREANPLLALVPLRMIDDYSFSHSINVGILNLAQGMSLGIEGQLLHDLGVAGMLHDAGKIFVDQEIIQKPGQLTETEWGIMQTHPSRGAQYLMDQKGVPPIAVITAYEHHMRYDLQGYPQTPEGWSLSLCSQMTMISDTFDALRTNRIYKDSWDLPKISGRMLEVVDAQLNRYLVVNFLKLLAEHGEKLPELPPDDTVPAKTCYCE